MNSTSPFMQVFFEPTYRSERKLVNELSIWKTLALPGPSVVYREARSRVFGTGTILLIEGVGYNGPLSAEYFQPIGSAAFEVWSASSFLQQLLLPGFTCINLSFPFLVFESWLVHFFLTISGTCSFLQVSSLHSSARLILTWCWWLRASFQAPRHVSRTVSSLFSCIVFLAY